VALLWIARVYERVGAISVERGTLPPGDAGVRKTLALMRRLAQQGASDLSVREAAIAAVRGDMAEGHDRVAQLASIYRFVRDRIYFVGDVLGVETIQSPRYTLSIGAGDCDDRATLLVAMARSIGISAGFSFKVIATNPVSQNFSHVYVVADLGGRKIAMDPTYRDNAFGWEYPRVFRTGAMRA
jgi:transglutaminase-like putative cysteine protease